MSFLDENLEINIISVLDLSWDIQNKVSGTRPYHALSYRISGDAEFETANDIIKVSKNDVCFVPAMLNYRLITHKKEHVIVIHFEANTEFEKRIEVFTPRNYAFIRERFESALKYWSLKKAGYKFSATSSIYKILAHLQRQHSEEAILNGSSVLYDAIEYIHEYYSDSSLTVARIAKAVNISEVYLRKLFMTALNTSPLKYINDLRLSHATELLQSGYYSVNKTAIETGFNDSKYFSTVMKKYRGCSPSDLLLKSKKHRS